MQNKDLQNLILSVIAAILVTAGVGLVLSFAPTLFEQLNAPAFIVAPGAIVKDPPVVTRDFTLTNQDGQPASLSSYKSKGLMVFFGYTHCPDVCPVTLAEFKKIKTELGPLANSMNFMFISVDGERDTPAVVKRYIDAFDSDFVGLTGDPEKVRGILTDFGGAFARQKNRGADNSYLVAHSSLAYFIDAQGRWRMAYPFETPAKDIAVDIKRILAEK